MTRDEAIKILNEALSLVKASLADHQLMQSALAKVISGDIDEPVEGPKESSEDK